MTLWESKVRIPSVFAISSLLKKTLPCERNYKFHRRNMPLDTRKLIMFANCSNPSSSFVIIKVSIYSGIIPCSIPPNNNHVFEPTFAQYDVTCNTHRLDRLGSNVRQ